MPTSLRVVEFSDRELLYVVEDNIDPDTGWASSQDIAASLGIDAKHPAQCVGQRMSWLHKMGVVDQDERKHNWWSPSELGYKMMSGDIRKALQTQLDNMDAAQLVTITAWLGRQYKSSVSESEAWLLRRQWTTGTYVPK